MERYQHIFIPIHEPQHFTLVYVNTQEKSFSYLNPLGEDIVDVNRFFKIFKEKTNVVDYNIKPMQHASQTEAILAEKGLENLENPNEYRRKIKSKLIRYSDDMDYVCLHCGLVCCIGNVCSSCGLPSCDNCFTYHYRNNLNFDKCKFCSQISQKKYSQ